MSQTDSNKADSNKTASDTTASDKANKKTNSDKAHCYDVVILGAGTAGQSAYSKVIQTTDNVLVINAGDWETTCARVGCMPSKTLIEASKYAQASKHAAEFGIENQTKIDRKATMARVQRLRDYFTSHAQKAVDAWPAKHKKQGEAQFIDANTIQVGKDIIHTKTTIVATGSTPRVVAEWQTALDHKLITSDSIFDLPELPKSMIVVGAGAIGIELAQAMARLGVEVTIINQEDIIGGLTNPELRQMATSLIAKELNFIDNSRVKKVSLQDNQVVLDYEPKSPDANSNKSSDSGSKSSSDKKDSKENDQQTSGHSGQIKADYLLAAIGRDSSINNLGLEKINSKYKDIKKPIHNLKTQQLDDLPIFIAGDVLTPHAIKHEASFDGRVSAINAAHYPEVKEFEAYAGLSIVFSSPQMAIAGQSHQSLKDNKTPFVCAEVSYEDQGRATIQDMNQGAVQLYGCPTSKRLLGAELLVNEAEHMAHLLAWSIQQKMTISQLLEMPFYHPVLEEGLRTALVRLNKKLG